MKSSLLNLCCLAALFFVGSAHATEKLAVVFAGPTIDESSRLDLAAVAEKRGYHIRYVQPGESTPALLSRAAVYIVPGGEDITQSSEGWTRSDLTAIQNFVRKGGKYWGVCLGGYWAGHEGTWPGTVAGFRALGLIPGTVRNHSATPEDRIERVAWRDGKFHFGYFQDGPEFEFANPLAVDVYGRYDNGAVAAFETNVGRGRIALSGVHWEATPDWYVHIEDRMHPGQFYDLTDPEPDHVRFAYEMFDALMAR